MAIKISEYTQELTTFDGTETLRQEVSMETSPSVWETKWYSWTTLKNKIIDLIWVDVVTTISIASTDDEIPTAKAVYDAIDAIPTPNLQAVTDGAGNNETTNSLIVGVVGTENIEYKSFEIIYNLDPFKTILSFVHPSSTNNVLIQDGSGTLAFITDIPTDVTNLINVTKYDLILLVNTPNVNPKTMYRITDATGGVVRVWGVSNNTISAAAFQEGSWDGTTLTGGAWGTYNVQTDTFTAISGGTLTAASFYTFIDSLSTIAAGTVDNADYINISDVSATLQKKISWSNFKTALQLSFDNIYQAILTAANLHTFVDSLTSLTTPVDADRMIIVDNSASLAKKITWANIKATLKTYFDSLYLTGNTAITGATKTKVTYDAKGLITSGADATTADIASSTDKRYVTDAQLIVIGNTSGTNSGNETTTTIGTLINGATAKTTPISADCIGLMDSAASNILKKVSISDLKTVITDSFTVTSYNGTWAAPADSTIYYFPLMGGIGTPLTTITSFLNTFTFAVKIVGICVQHLNVTGTVGSSENVSVGIRNNTDGTNNALINIQTTQANGVIKNFEDYSLNVDIPANKAIATYVSTPAWVTNPTNLGLRITLFIQKV